jgi:hypothetical protein
MRPALCGTSLAGTGYTIVPLKMQESIITRMLPGISLKDISSNSEKQGEFSFTQTLYMKIPASISYNLRQNWMILFLWILWTKEKAPAPHLGRTIHDC